MKTLAYYLLGIFSLCILNACGDEDSPTPEPPPSKGQEEVQKIVEVLESQPEISQFVDMLKQVDVADLNENQLTRTRQAAPPSLTPLPSETTSPKEAMRKKT